MSICRYTRGPAAYDHRNRFATCQIEPGQGRAITTIACRHYYCCDKVGAKEKIVQARKATRASTYSVHTGTTNETRRCSAANCGARNYVPHCGKGIDGGYCRAVRERAIEIF